MMKENDDNVDLGLALGNSNKCLKTRLTSDRGAGVNAGSRVDMAFAASDPLSELVWSPHKGLSLKCADSSFSDRKPFLLWNVGPSNLIQYPPQSIRSREDNDNKSTTEGNLLVSEAAFHVNGELVEETGLARSPRSKTSPAYGTNCGDHTECTGKEEMNTAEEVCELLANQNDRYHGDYEENNLCNNFICDMDQSKDHNAGQRDGRILNFLHRGSSNSNFALALSRPLSNKLDEKTSISCGGRMEDVASGRKILGAGIAMASDAHGVKEHDGHLSSLQGLPPQLEAGKEFTMAKEQEIENKITRQSFISAAPLEKIESIAENDLLPLVRSEVSKQSDKNLPSGNALKASPTNSRMDLYRRKGKEKALSEGHVLERVSNADEDSHGSMESSNSAGLFAKGRKRWNLEESTGGSKRAKREIEETPASTSTIRHDSSFMNWISNMVKGYSRVNQDEDPSLALTMAYSHLQRESDQQDIIVSNKKCDGGCRTMGFRTMFQSLYCPSMRKPELRALEVEHSGVESNELVLSSKTSVQMPRVACSGEKDKSCKKNAPRSSILGGPSSQLQIMPVSAAPMQEVYGTNSGGNKASSDLGFHLYDRVNLSDPLCKQQNNIPENNNLDLLSEDKAIHDKSEGNCNVGSLWITRLSNKNSSTTVKLDYGNRKEHRVSDYSDRTRLNDNQITSNIRNEHKTAATGDDRHEEAVAVLCKNLKKFSETVEESAHKEAYRHNYQKSVPKLDPILPSSKCKSSEAMASVFARRLDAFKHISPSDMKSGMTSGMRTCLFCGRPGHDLRYCTDTTESDLEALLRNINSYGSIEGSSCLCLMCFQLDHWAKMCPGRSLGRQQKLKLIASSIGDGTEQLSGGNKKYSSILEKRGHEPLNTANLLFMSSDADIVMRNVKVNHGKRISNSNDVKCIPSNSVEYALGERQILPLCNFVSKQMVDVPKGLLDAIRKLRLSRGEVLKWISSNVSLSHLDGFFLRLRLGKWEAGLGGTGYYVACITGGENENSAKDSKNPISVNVGGIQFLVGIQYVSNHDFLEDELVAWWCRTLKNGAKVPSKEELKSKFEERVKLGF